MPISGTAVADVEPLVVKPRDARRMLACGNTRLYELLTTRELVSFLDGRSRKITVESIRQYIARRLTLGQENQPRRRGRPRKPRESTHHER
jgi:hypothetical protein